MADSAFSKVANYGESNIAEHVCSILKENEIDAFVDGANANSMMSHVGTALGGVTLYVRNSDRDRALEIIESLDEDEGFSEPWFCSNCNVEVEGNFQICWSCSLPRSEVEAEMPGVANEADLHFSDEKVEAFAEQTDEDAANPYASPRAHSSVDDKPPQPKPEFDQKAEDMILRAFRASIVGLVILPFIAHAYSIFLLFSVNGLQDVSPRSNVRFWTAISLNVVAAAVWGFAIGGYGF